MSLHSFLKIAALIQFFHLQLSERSPEKPRVTRAELDENKAPPCPRGVTVPAPVHAFPRPSRAVFPRMPPSPGLLVAKLIKSCGFHRLLHPAKPCGDFSWFCEEGGKEKCRPLCWRREEMNSSPSTLRFFSCLKIPGLVLDPPAGTGDGFPQPELIYKCQSGLQRAQGQVPQRRWGHRVAGVPCLVKGEWLSSGLWEGTEVGGWAQRGT